MRSTLLRYAVVVGIGVAVLASILYYAATVDGRAPLVERIALTLHTSDDDQLALTTTSIEVAFSEPVRTETAEAAFRIEPQTSGEFTWSGTTLRFTPEERLPLETEFSVRIEAGVEDEVGNTMTDPTAAFEFRTVGPPSVAATQPENGETGVALAGPIVIDFSSLMDTASVEGALRIEPTLAVEVSWSAERLTLVPVTGLREGTRYRVSIGTDARDSAGIPLVAPFEVWFESVPSPIAVAQVLPADGTEGVAAITPVAVVFDRALDVDADVGDLLSIEPQVAGTLEVSALPGAAGVVDPEPRMLSFVPSGPLAPNTTYRVTLEPGLTAADGSQVTEQLEWSFTTGAPLGTLSNQIVFLSDRSGIANLWAMNPDGSGQRQLSAELSPIIDYAVSPDGGNVVVGDGAVLVILDADGTSRRVITSGDVLEFDPAWSPDGERFAFGRADLATGEGLGLWTRDREGSDDVPVELPGERSSPRPSASPSSSATRAAILRAPRYAPDGAALAYIDLSGRIGVLDLDDGHLRTAAFAAVTPPVWLEDSSALLLSGLPGEALDEPEAGQPLPSLDADGLELAAEEIRRLRIVRLAVGATSTSVLDVPPGATLPAISADRLLYVRDGTLWLAGDVAEPALGRPLVGDDDAPVTSGTFGLETRSVLAVRGLGNDGAGDRAVWLLDALTGSILELAGDGWTPRWLP